MMKRLLLALLVGLGLMQTPARAGITCTLPNVLVNGTVADAGQVMANFNAITACLLGNIAASGANNDITGLFALTTPIAPINGGTPTYIGSNSGGTVNAQTVTTTVPSNFALSGGRSVQFFAGLTNTAAMTLDVAGSGAISVVKRGTSGVIATSGGEVVTGHVVVVTYNGTQWVLQQPSPKADTFQIFNTAAANQTYTNPGASWIEVRLIGAGGAGGNAGGAGADANPGGSTCWNSSGTACTGPLSAATGGAGGKGGGGLGSGGSGGSSSGSCNETLNGTTGGTSPTFALNSGMGGGSSIAQGAQATPASGNGGVAGINGGGGSGASTSAAGQLNGGGGGGGGTCVTIISNPAATYTYTVGAGGTTNIGGDHNGGTGGAGYIKVIEHYQ